MFALVSSFLPRPPAGAAPPPQWGDPVVVRDRLGEAVTDLTFDSDLLLTPGLSPNHVLRNFERTAGPLVKLVESLESEPARLKELRSSFLEVIRPYYRENQLHQSFLMSRATKR
jgi:hypothetical protein